MPTDFPGAFNGLRRILKRHATGMTVLSDTPSDFTVVTAAIAPNKGPLWFGAVLSKKSAVTYHLMPLYFNPILQSAISPALHRRKQGKTCFNFQRPDPALFAELDEITRRGREGYEKHGFLKPGVITADQLNALLRAAGADPEAIAKARKAKARTAAAKRAATIKKNKAAHS